MFLSLALAAAAMAQDKPAAPAAPANPVIISAGDVKITKSEFEDALKSLPPEYQQYAQGAGKRQFAEDYLRMKMLATRGMAEGLANDPDVQQQLKLMRENLVANAELKKIDAGIKISDADLKKLYDASAKDYEQVKASHILIAFKGSPAAQPGKPELTEEQAKAKAEDIRKQLVAGADFAEMAKKESDDTGSGSRGGDLGEFGHGQMVPEFEQAAFAAKPGDITPVVRTQYGYHILKVESKGATPFEQVKPTLEKRERQKRLQETLDAFKSSAKPTFDDKYFPAPAPPPSAAATTPPPAKP